jgi:Zn-finger nucleic acid-binding protein
MQCPRCKGSLCAEKYQHAEFNICSGCRGIWTSGGQFRGLAVLVSTDEGVESSEKLTFKARNSLRPGQNNVVRICPECDLVMREFNYAYDSNVFLDRCEQCEGIWLDPNEIIDIAKHIKYNPKLHAVGSQLAALVKKNDDDSEEMEWYGYLLTAAFVILRLLIFKR